MKRITLILKLWKSTPFFAFTALMSALLFGAATPASKVLLQNLSAFQLAGLLYLGGALGVLIVVLRQRNFRFPWKMTVENQLRLLGAVFFGGMLGPVFLLLGLKMASAASVSMWLNLELIATAILGRLIFHDHLGKYGWFGVMGVTVAGVLLCAHEGIAGIWAGLLVAAACTCWGLDNHFTALIDGITPSQSTLWKGLVAGSVNLTIGLFISPFESALNITFGALIIGALSYGVSITLYISSAQGLGATRAQMFFASAPFWGVALSIIILGESISIFQILAGGILICSLIMLFHDQHRHKHQHEPMEHEHSHNHEDDHHTHIHPGLQPSHRHSHCHKHEQVQHAHPHWPDLQHRHKHN